MKKQRFQYGCKTFTEFPYDIGGVIDAWMNTQTDDRFHIYHLFKTTPEDSRKITVNILYRAAIKEPEPVVKPGW